MKKLVLYTAITLLSVTSFAQKIQFSNSTNVWSMIDSTLGCCIPMATVYTTAYYDSVPVNYNGHTYQYLITSIGSVLTREDAGKVYILDNTDSVERLMYDFTLGLNDTIHIVYPGNRFTTWPVSIDSTLLQGEWYKVWHFEGADTSLYYPDSVREVRYNVIEGIGCTNGPYYPSNPYSLSAFSQQLLCFNNNSGITTGLSNSVIAYGYEYFSYYDNDSSCIEFYSDHTPPPIVHPESVNELARSEGKALVVPNPVNNTSRIVLPNHIQTGTVTILNQLGQTTYSQTIQNTDDVNIGGHILVSGIYYYLVTNNESGEIHSGKFIRQ